MLLQMLVIRARDDCVQVGRETAEKPQTMETLMSQFKSMQPGRTLPGDPRVSQSLVREFLEWERDVGQREVQQQILFPWNKNQRAPVWCQELRDDTLLSDGFHSGSAMDSTSVSSQPWLLLVQPLPVWHFFIPVKCVCGVANFHNYKSSSR